MSELKLRPPKDREQRIGGTSDAKIKPAFERSPDLDVHADVPDPRIRRARETHFRGASRRDSRARASGGRRGSKHRRMPGDARGKRSGDAELPLPRLPAGAGNSGALADGGDLSA